MVEVTALTGGGRLADNAAAVLRHVCEAVPMDAAAFYVVGEEARGEVVAAYGRTRRRGFPYPQLDVSLPELREALERGVDSPSEPSGSLTALLSAVLCPGARHSLIAPVRLGQDPTGVLVISRRREDPLGEREQSLVSVALHVLGALLHNSELSRATELNAAVLETAYTVSRAISRHLDLDETFRVIAANAARLVKGSRCLLLELDAEADELVAVASSEVVHDTLLGARLRFRGSTMAEMMLQRHLALEVEDVVWSASVSSLERTTVDARFVLFLPMIAGNEPIGALVLFVAGDSVEVGGADLELVEEMAEQAASAIHNARLYGDLTRSREHVETLLAGMARMRELERQGLARLLHDDVIQSVVGAAYKLEIALTQIPEESRPRVGEALAILREAISGARSVVSNLRPPELDELGLAPTVAALVERLQRDWTAKIGTIIEDVPGLDGVKAAALCKIAREALTNSCRHADAEGIWITLQSRIGANGREAWLMVWDDGRGFSVGDLRDDTHYGLSMMREQAAVAGGIVRVSSALGKGTTVEVVVPVS